MSNFFDMAAPLNVEMRYNHGDHCLLHGERTGDYKERFYVKRVADGFFYHCKNCNHSGFTRITLTDIPRDKVRERLAQFLNCQQAERNILTQPRSSYRDEYNILECQTNEKFLDFIVEKRLSKSEANDISYNEKSGRIRLNCFDISGDYVGYQERCLAGGTGPKYLTYKAPSKIGTMYHFQPAKFPVYDDNVVVLVEDIVSSIIVSRYCPSIALLGSPSRLSPDLLDVLAERFSGVLVWLDPDKRKTAMTLRKQIVTVTGVPTSVILSDDDPKDTPEDTMRRLLAKGYCATFTFHRI